MGGIVGGEVNREKVSVWLMVKGWMDSDNGMKDVGEGMIILGGGRF